MSTVMKTVGTAANMAYRYYECDSLSDRNNLPVNEMPQGSRALVFDSDGEGTVALYTLNGSKEWKKIELNLLKEEWM